MMSARPASAARGKPAAIAFEDGKVGVDAEQALGAAQPSAKTYDDFIKNQHDAVTIAKLADPSM
jgi:hypothetical protein